MTTALVTGANRGLGLAVVRRLAELGTTVALSARRTEDAENAARAMRDGGLDVHPLQLDVTDRASIARAEADLGRRFEALDILVNNAGVLPEATDASPHEFADAAVFRHTFDVNVFGTVAVTEALLPMLRRSRAGRIVNVSTTMGSLGDQSDPSSPYYGMVVPAYQASKAALNSVTIGLAKTLANTGVVVTAVCPGFVQTDLTPVNREQAPLSADEAASVVVRAACLPSGSASGTFVDRDGLVAW